MYILVAEDETDIRNLLKLNLEQEGYHVYPAADGLEALDLAEKNSVDLAILDIMMPKLDGFNLLRRIRAQYNFPIILLTARGDDMDKVLGLGLGADDYLVKPFSMAELMARVAAQLRRSKAYYMQEPLDDQSISSGDLVLDKKGCTIRRGESTIELNAKEYLILKHLMENPNRVFTKKQLYHAVWDEDLYYDDNTIMVHISHIRNKIEMDPRNPEHLITIRGLGYK
ncbi:MAG TPA: response regulator transcription factor, partial [Anaerovoracaceae bacterium]|nr:response regulator transcription factor [Anaerovoracaceae bacterium]